MPVKVLPTNHGVAAPADPPENNKAKEDPRTGAVNFMRWFAPIAESPLKFRSNRARIVRYTAGIVFNKTVE